MMIIFPSSVVIFPFGSVVSIVPSSDLPKLLSLPVTEASSRLFPGLSGSVLPDPGLLLSGLLVSPEPLLSLTESLSPSSVGLLLSVGFLLSSGDAGLLPGLLPLPPFIIHFYFWGNINIYSVAIPLHFYR